MTVFDQVIVLGTGKIAARCIEILSRHTNAITSIEQEAQALSGSQAVCRKQNLPYLFIPDKSELTAYLNAVADKTLLVSANNNYLFPHQIVEKDNLCIVNFHNALLPAYPGRNAPTWVIYGQEPITGITWHLVDAGVDTGDLLIQVSRPVGPLVTALELTRQCMEDGIGAFERMIPGILQGRNDCRKQLLQDRKNFHRADEIPNHGYLDVTWPIDKMSAFLRSLDYGKLAVFPPPRIRLDGQSYWINKYRLQPIPRSEKRYWLKPGELIVQTDELLVYMKLEGGTADEQYRGDHAGDQAGNQFFGM